MGHNYWLGECGGAYPAARASSGQKSSWGQASIENNFGTLTLMSPGLM